MSDFWDDMSLADLRIACEEMHKEIRILQARKTLEDEFAVGGAEWVAGRVRGLSATEPQGDGQ